MVSIEVSGIPVHYDTADVAEHFEEEARCIDALSYVLHPLDGDRTRAIIAFRDSNAAKHVEKCSHQMGDSTLEVEFRPRDMFKWCTVQVDSLVLVTCAPRIEQCLGAIETELGVHVERSSGGVVTLTGSLTQINAANGRLLALWLHQVARQKKAMGRIRRQSYDVNPSSDASLSEVSKGDIDAVGGLTLSDNEVQRSHMVEFDDYDLLRDETGDGSTDRHDITDELLYDADLLDFRSESPQQPESPFVASANGCRGMEELLRQPESPFAASTNGCRGMEELLRQPQSPFAASTNGCRGMEELLRQPESPFAASANGCRDMEELLRQPESPFAASANGCRGMEELLRRARGLPKFDSSDCFVGQRLQPSSDCDVDFDFDFDQRSAEVQFQDRYSGDTHVNPGSQSQQEDSYIGLANRTSDPRLPSREPSETKSVLDASLGGRFSDEEDYNGTGDATDALHCRDQSPPPTTQAVGVLFDRDIVGFVQQVHCHDLAVIENNLHVRLKFEEVGDRIRIDISLPRPYDMLTQNIDTARMHLGNLFDDVANVVEKKRFYYRGDDITPDQIEELMAGLSHDFKNLFLHLVCHGEMLLIGNHAEIQRVCETIESHIERCHDWWRHPLSRGAKCGDDEERSHATSNRDSDVLPAHTIHQLSRCGINGNGYITSGDNENYDKDTIRKTQNVSARTCKSDTRKQRTSGAGGKSPSRIPTRQQSGCSLVTKSQLDRSSNGKTHTGRHFQFSLGGNLNVIVYDGDITTEAVDIIVSAANVHLANYSGVARAISQAAGQQYDEDCTEYVARHGPLTISAVVPMEVSGGLPCRYVLHAVGPMWSLYADKSCCSSDLRRTFYNCLCTADDLGASAMAVPPISTGIFKVPVDVCAQSLLVALQQFVSERPRDRSLQTVRVVNISSAVTDVFAIVLEELLSVDGYAVVHIADKDVECTRGSGRNRHPQIIVESQRGTAIDDMLVPSSGESMTEGSVGNHIPRQSLNSRISTVKQCTTKTPRSLVDGDTRRPSDNKTPSRSRPMSVDRMRPKAQSRRHSASLSRQRSMDELFCEHNQRRGLKSQNVPPHSSEKISRNLRQTLSRRKTSSTNNALPLRPSNVAKTGVSKCTNEVEKCPICMKAMVLPKTLQKCGHRYCSKCINDYFYHGKPVCPLCGMVYGVLKGDQPERGVMSWGVDRSLKLPGYVDSIGAIVIKYSFPDGIQQDCHPHPGMLYGGVEFKAFLPSNANGRGVVAMLKTAFDAGLVFKISDSRVTGQQSVITWNDISHKTSILGGPIVFGYPDTTYLDRVKGELAAKGITTPQPSEQRKKPRKPPTHH